MALEAAALILGLCVVGLILLLDRLEDCGRISASWRRRHEAGRDQR